MSTDSTGKSVLLGLLPVPLPLETEATFHKRKWYLEVAAEVASGSTARVAGTSGQRKTAETAKLNRAYLLHPDSVFDDLGLVGKRATRAYTTKNQIIETSQGDCADRKSTRLNSSHSGESRMPSSA